jgi:hypothetical protein
MKNLRLCLLELEPHHPVGQTAGRHLCCRSACGVELERRQASPMIPLESSALSMTLIALASALWVTAYTSLDPASGSPPPSCRRPHASADRAHSTRSTGRGPLQSGSAGGQCRRALSQYRFSPVANRYESVPLPDGSHADRRGGPSPGWPSARLGRVCRVTVGGRVDRR